MKKIFKFTVVLVLLSSCYYDNEEELYGLECDLDNVTYATEIERIMETSCAVSGCHDGSTQYPIYDNYQSILQDTGKIFERVILQKNMPPGEALQDCDFDQLDLWIKNGAIQ